ncbi:MAG TPA: Type 1 glutamine amidotransferase-like domain-containing protein [Candidatus Absconditabacterales bacterium]|nr:Type 1 glutamine amidotransferase-like domain-containing protein [Candidatus Absconditabacterales bacterium]
MQLFLASALEYVKDFFVEKIGNIKGKTIGFISNPADLDRKGDIEPRWVIGDKNMLKSLGGIIKTIDIRELKNDGLFEVISNVDLLYVSGGNTRYFKTLADENGYQKIINELIIKKGLPYISTSAGSCVMGTSIKYLDPGEFKIEQGYGLINAMILPHWGSENFKEEYEEVIPKLYNESQNIITLNDRQVIYVDSNGYEILG